MYYIIKRNKITKIDSNYNYIDNMLIINVLNNYLYFFC